MSTEMDESIIVFFNEKECTLGEAIRECQPGEVIEHVPFRYFGPLLHRFQNDRGQKYSYSIDRRYGDWRFILFGTRNVANIDQA